MKKFFALLLALVMALSLVACGEKAPADDGAAPDDGADPEVEVIKLDIASLYTDGQLDDKVCLLLKDLLNESGLFEVNYYNNSQLGSLYDQIESIVAGSNLIACGGGSDWGDRVGVPLMAVTMTPFLYDSVYEMYGVTEADYFLEMLDQAEENAGVKIFSSGIISGGRCFIGTKQYMTPDDMVGQKLRVPNSSAYINAFTAFKATPTPIAVSELYSALTQKMVDGYEFPGYAVITNGYYETPAKYIADTPYVYTFDFFGMNADLWETFSDEQKAVFEDALKQASQFSFETYEAEDAGTVEELKSLGMEYYTPDIQAFRDCMPTFYELSGWDAAFIEQVETAMAEYRAANN